MHTPCDPRLASWFRRCARAAAGAVVVVGCLALAGWALGLETLKSVFPGLVAMNPATALAFLLAGVALWLSATPAGPAARRAAWACAAAVVGVGLLRLGG